MGIEIQLIYIKKKIMKELSRFELAIIKRTAQNTKSLRSKRDKLVEKIKKAEEELSIINMSIDSFEAPIKTLTGGYTSEEVLLGIMEVSEATELVPEGEISEEIVEEIEVPASEAVSITEDIPQSPNPFGDMSNASPFKD